MAINSEAITESDDLQIEVLQQAPISFGSRIRRVIEPGGRKNRNVRLVLLILAGVVIAFVWMLLAGSAQTQPTTSKLRAHTASSVWMDDASPEGPLVSAPPPSATLGAPPSGPVPQEQTATTAARHAGFESRSFPGYRPAPAFALEEDERIHDTAGSAPRPNSVFATEPQEPFAMSLRASGEGPTSEVQPRIAQKASPASEQARSSAEPAIRLARGLEIPMQLLDPVATGVKSRARIRVAGDVFDPEGNIMIPNGATGDLPFAAGEILGGRVVLDSHEHGVLRINGQELAITGSVRDQDGRVGLKGKVKKSGGSGIVRRTLGAVGRTASGIAGRSGVPVYEIESAVGQSGYGGVYGSYREVVVEKGARFTFIFGQ